MRNKIAVKLTAGLILIVLLSMLTIGLVFIQMFRQYAFESREKVLLQRAESIAQVVTEYYRSNGSMRGFGGFMRYLDTLSEAHVWITDQQGNPALMSGMGPGHRKQGEPLPPEANMAVQDVLAGKTTVSQSFSSIYNEATLTVGAPVRDAAGLVTGAVLLHAPVTGVTETLDKAVKILLFSLAVALVLAAGLGIFYSRRFTRPLQAMNLAALEMAKGHYTVRTGIDRQDELGQLGRSLDLLATQLDTTINQLFQEKGKLNDIIASIAEGIFALDKKMRPLSLNQALAAIMGRPQTYDHAMLAADLAALEIEREFDKVLTQKTPVSVVKEWLGKKLKITLAPILDNRGEAAGCVALVQDISESERLEEMRRDFVANVSHEFRTPLTIIRGSLEALLDGTVTEKSAAERYHRRMLTETRGLERLVGDLLDLARFQAGKITVNKEQLDLGQLLEAVIKSLQPIAAGKNIRIVYQAPANLPPVWGDYDRLRRLFIIFLDNAIKYSRGNTTVTVTIAGKEHLTITIADQGEGIAAADLPYIWDRFYKADKARSRVQAGTGLGLAIARHIIELHGGTVHVESTVGTGTKFSIRLPAATPTQSFPEA